MDQISKPDHLHCSIKSSGKVVKEEDILFRDLKKKNLREADRRVMNDFVEEHIVGRQTTEALILSNTR